MPTSASTGETSVAVDPTARDVPLVATGLHRSVVIGGRRREVLRGASLSLAAGELVAVTGPSGSGKTTLLHCLSGIVAADRGSVRIAGTELTTLDEDGRTDLRARTMGFVFQRLNLLPALTVAENVQLPLVMAGRPRREVLDRSRTLLELVGLAEREASAPADLSGGEAQRVAIARALACEPAVVFADEPTGSLDRVTAATVVDQLAAVAQRGTAVLLATHDAAVVERADRHLALVDGRLE